MRNITYQVFDSLHKIKKEEWDLLFGDLPEGYQFYKTLEESGLEGFIFYYIVLYSAGKAQLIAPLFVTDFNLDIGVEGILEKVIFTIRKPFPNFLTLKTLFCGSPFAERGVLGIRNIVSTEGQDSYRKRLLLLELNKGMQEFCKEKKINLMLFKDFPEDQVNLMQALKSQGFFRVKSFPSIVNDLKFGSFEEYLLSLSSSTRKNLRRKLKKTYNQAKINIEVLDDCSDVVEDILRLYENTYHGGSTQFEKLNRNFFLNVGLNLKPHARFFLYYVNGKLAAFNLCFVYKDLLIDKFIGFDYDVSRRYSLYFVSWCFNVEWCLKNSIRYYHTGQTDYGPKVQLGGKVVTLYAYIKHRNVLCNLFFRILALLLKPDNFDHAI